MDALSVQETYFWREADQISCVADKLVPEHFRRHPNRPLRIWSAACATGEEPLSIAMALDRDGWLSHKPIEILASDASEAALEKARRGVYRERSFRSIPVGLRERYFSPAENGWAVDARLKERVTYSRANVFEETDVSALAASDIIFCRNMFIYFSVPAIRKTVSSFARRMRTPGYLFVGSSESLINITDEFRLDQINGAFVYVNNKE
jgi:chemotaxis protein methyltransferase CheR